MDAKKLCDVAYASLDRGDFASAEEEASALLALLPDSYDGHLIRLLAHYRLHGPEGLSYLELPLSQDPLFAAALRTASEADAERLRLAAVTAERRSVGLHEKYAALSRGVRAIGVAGSVYASAYHSLSLDAAGKIRVVGDNGDARLVFPERRFTSLAVSDYHALALDASYRVYATGANDAGQCRVRTWRGVRSVKVGFAHSLGLTEDGRVLATGDNRHGQCEVGTWRDVVSIAAGAFTSYGITRDGRVLSAGRTEYGECDTDAWREVAAVYPSDFHTVARLRDGTLLAVGRNDDGQCEVGGIRDVIDVAVGCFHTLCLLSDGRVAAVGRNDLGQCSTSEWYGITAISAGRLHSVGLTTDGRVLTVGDNGFGQCGTVGWRSAVAIAAGAEHTLAMTATGRVLGIGRNSYSDPSGRMRTAGQSVTKRLLGEPMHLPLLAEALRALTDGKHSLGLELLGRLGELPLSSALSERILGCENPDRLIPLFRELLTELTSRICRMDAVRRELKELHRFSFSRRAALRRELREIAEVYRKPMSFTRIPE